MPKILAMAMWRSRIIATTAPGRIVAPSFPLSKPHDMGWLVAAISCPPSDDYKDIVASNYKERPSKGDVTLGIEGAQALCYSADLLALMDAHHRFHQREADHRVPQLVNLWQYFEETFTEALHTSEWQDWIPTLKAFSEALQSAACAWGDYVAKAMGTMGLAVRVPHGKALVLDRVDGSGASIPVPVPVVVYLLEKEPMDPVTLRTASEKEPPSKPVEPAGEG